MDEVILGCITVLLYIVLGLWLAWGLQVAWNILIPALFHGPSITYGMACVMYALISLIGSTFKATITTSSKD